MFCKQKFFHYFFLFSASLTSYPVDPILVVSSGLFGLLGFIFFYLCVGCFFIVLSVYSYLVQYLRTVSRTVLSPVLGTFLWPFFHKNNSFYHLLLRIQAGMLIHWTKKKHYLNIIQHFWYCFYSMSKIFLFVVKTFWKKRLNPE